MASSGIYYNEIDPFCAQWLRNLMIADMIPEGDVDERSIEDVTPADVSGYVQCHFFAGIGGWPCALRLAGWPDDRAVWTGSCPCQPFSTAGKGVGFADERHLWPAFYWLISQCRPSVLFGEQVGSPAALSWLDLVFDDMEGIANACAALDLPAASVGAPHIRQRLFWMAYAERAERGQINFNRQEGRDGPNSGRAEAHGFIGTCGEVRGLAYADTDGCGTPRPGIDHAAERDAEPCGGLGRAENVRSPSRPREPNARYFADQSERSSDAGSGVGHPDDLRRAGVPRSETPQRIVITGAHDPWHELEWIECLDGKRRPTQPGIFPLAPRVSGDVGRLRAYGNAIVPQVAAEVIRAFMDYAP